MKVIIAGGRDFNNYKLLVREVSSILNSMVNIPMEEMEIVSGHHWEGADKLGEQYAKENNFKLITFPANWEGQGRKAGHLRNKAMAEYATPNGILIAFWDLISKGTKSMIDKAKKAGLKIHIIEYKT